jgi:hypothetical protein
MLVAVGDQNGNPIPPANIAWAAASELTITADATGFNIAAVSRGTATSFSLTATDPAQTPIVSVTAVFRIRPGISNRQTPPSSGVGAFTHAAPVRERAELGRPAVRDSTG